ncbi:PLP-dependent transferase [Pseudovirgaria hyperparasitica]|uniref:PLP-dependent transferase n=1 Tax=Pseudovirgaria hyperparasitica TaxID=470096 RepID=A0A6A6WIC4_9PEZI|nr:PLP-dependent transferase [Pseudovirgaria hyperparasitica]KAF2762538.1 PLP-dependent transferase [Pseudovirgaria hyperparasitica]
MTPIGGDQSTQVETQGDASHQIISSHFIGPQSENLPYFKQNIDTILDELEKARARYFPKDKSFITQDVQDSPAFRQQMQKLRVAVQKTANILGRTSIPCWSPRYEAHMCTDLSMASLLGYFMTMMYNPNNVALEASPFSTVAEIEVGEQLCELFGYNINEDDLETPTAWGHVTCGGTVANLESMWVARNLKFYPLSIFKAMTTGKKPLGFLGKKFHIETCQGEQKLFSKLSTWELLNLKPSDVLDIPDRLYQEHGVSNVFLSKVMEEYTIQSTGKGVLESDFDLLDRPAQYLLATTRHYSWPKGAAVAGIGSDNVIGIQVDNEARIDIAALEARLEESLKDERPILAVVAIIGSTEEGAVDPLSSILALRKQYQTRGLSFLVHGDAAWGGYFCSMLPRNYAPGDVLNLPTEMGDGDGFVPDACLRAQTQDDLFALRFADSITVDPHKAGYIPYPAGGLCYRDGRMRFLVTWTSPYLSRGSVTSIGIYGVEGSKPGAAAVSTWLSNKVIGLGQEGYGKLLGEVTWTCSRFSAEWASLSNSSTPFICVPLNKLPSERAPGSTSAKVEAEKAWIKSEIVNKSNTEILDEDRRRPDSHKAVKLLRELGSDLNINAFSLNFTLSNGRVNDDIEEANYLMQRVVQAFSVESPADDPTKIPFYLTSTEFSNELYDSCKADLMRRLGLKPSNQNLMVLRNVVMSPFPSDGGFIREMCEVFEQTVRAEISIVRKRNEVTEDFHKFLMQGTEQVYLIHLPMFHVANHRQQLIVSVELDEKSKAMYRSLKQHNPTEPMILVTQTKVELPDIVSSERGGTFVGQIRTEASGTVLKDVKVQITGKVVSRPLNSAFRLDTYPEDFMPFYLYGSPTEANIDHVIVKAPNTQLSAGRCELDIDGLEPEHWKKPLLLIFEDFAENPMQPFPPNDEIGSKHGAVISHEHFEPSQISKLASTPTNGHANENMVDSGIADMPLRDPADLKSGIAKPSSLNGSEGYDFATTGATADTLFREAENDSEFVQLNKGAAVITSEIRSGRAHGSKFFFRPRATFRVSVWEDLKRGEEKPESVKPDEKVFVGRGTLKLGESVYVDSEAINVDPFAKVNKIAEWRHELNQIGKDIEQETYQAAAYGGTGFR